MKKLFLADLKDMTLTELRKHIVEEYEAKRKDVMEYDFLIAYEHVGWWGCDSDSFFLMRHKKTGKLFENHGEHCSCYGFEGQFEPEETTKKYLLSDKFSFYGGGYDDDRDLHKEQILSFIKKLKARIKKT